MGCFGRDNSKADLISGIPSPAGWQCPFFVCHSAASLIVGRVLRSAGHDNRICSICQRRHEHLQSDMADLFTSKWIWWSTIPLMHRGEFLAFLSFQIRDHSRWKYRRPPMRLPACAAGRSAALSGMGELFEWHPPGRPWRSRRNLTAMVIDMEIVRSLD